MLVINVESTLLRVPSSVSYIDIVSVRSSAADVQKVDTCDFCSVVFYEIFGRPDMNWL